jgi:hypothetical protein
MLFYRRSFAGWGSSRELRRSCNTLLTIHADLCNARQCKRGLHIRTRDHPVGSMPAYGTQEE